MYSEISFGPSLREVNFGDAVSQAEPRTPVERLSRTSVHKEPPTCMFVKNTDFNRLALRIIALELVIAAAAGAADLETV